MQTQGREYKGLPLGLFQCDGASSGCAVMLHRCVFVALQEVKITAQYH